MTTIESALREAHSRVVTVLVDSRDRDRALYPRASEYRVRMPTPLRYVQAGWVTSCEMPHSFYAFDQAHENTSLTVAYNEVPRTVTVPDGNYTTDTLADALKQALEGAFPDTTFTVAFPDVTRRCVLSVVPRETLAVYPGDAPEGRSLAHMLGFHDTDPYVDLDGTLEAPFPVQLVAEPYLLLDVPGMGNLIEAGVRGVGGAQSTSTFAKIPLSQESGTYVFHDKPITFNDIHPPIETVQELSIRWRFHGGFPVDFQGFEHALTFQFVCSDLQ